MAATKFRSKYRGYQWRDVPFANHVATVSNPETVKQMQADPAYGADFWIDAGVDEAAAAKKAEIAEAEAEAKGKKK